MTGILKFAQGIHIYWFSFYLDNEFKGTYLLENSSLEAAILEIEELGIQPEYDQRDKYVLTKKPDNLELDILYSPQEMLDKGYVRQKT